MSARRGEVQTAIYWLFEPPVPQNYPATLEEGLDWCVERLRTAGVDASREKSALLAELSQKVAI